jgi:TetR/AcrR family transcriptional repressor of nem operon
VDTLKPDVPRTRDPERTRERILDAAQDLILDHGFGATTVDAVTGRAGITKGAFFHHFPSKAELGRALAHRYAELDETHLRENMARAEKLASDPLQQLLVFVALYEEQFAALDQPFPGCLFASYIYENKLFDEDTLVVLRRNALVWREALKAKLAQVVARHPPGRPVDIDTLSDLFYALTEGTFVMTKTLGDRTLLVRQCQLLRTLIEQLFAPVAAP